MEYPECPYCGAIQEARRYIDSTTEILTCHSCDKQFRLDVQVTRRYHATRID